MIFTRHSVLKRGCSTWDKQLMPIEEFEVRLNSARSEMAKQNLDALVIYGDNYSFADLCYLTNYFPKVRGGIAVVPRQGGLSLLLNIGSRDVPFAKTLTWVDDVRASNLLGRDGAELLKEKNLTAAKIGFLDSGRGFPLPELEALKTALPGVQWQFSDSLVQQLRFRKNPRELAAIRHAGVLLEEICEAAPKFIRRGRKEYEIVADIDRYARDRGVEDIRILAGENRLQPPSFKMSASFQNHWALYLAIQHERYWAEAGRTFILSDDAKTKAAYQRAQEIVAQMAAQLKPGNSVVAIAETGRKQLGEFYATSSVYGLGNGIGLDQWESPFVIEDDARQLANRIEVSTLQQDMTLALRVVFETEGKLIIFGDTYEVTAGGAKSLLTNS